MQDHELAILFTYYQDDEVTRIHHALVEHYNPGVPVIPVYDSFGLKAAEPFLPDSADVDVEEWRWGDRSEPIKNSIDTFAYRAYEQYREVESQGLIGRIENFALIESDTLVTMPLLEWFRAGDDRNLADVTASVNAYPKTSPDWMWWPKNPGLIEPHLAGVMPSGVVMFSRGAIEAMHRIGLYPLHAEVRIGTLAKLTGHSLAEVPGGVKTVHCDPSLIALSSEPGVYHPVKVFGGPNGECREAHEFGRSLLSQS